MSRFVRPEFDTLTLANGDTLTVKRRLNSGEQRDAYARMYVAGLDGALRVNPLETGMALITAYLLDWNLKGDDGAPVAIAGITTKELTQVLDGLDYASFTEIKEAIEAHEVAQDAARREKKLPSGEPSSSPTSASPSAPDGNSTGSAS